MSKVAPPLIIILGVGIVGFVMSLGWSKVAGGNWDHGKVIFLAKMWSGIVFAGIVITFVAVS